jgi:hypothetical protein
VYRSDAKDFSPINCPALSDRTTILLFDPPFGALEPALMPCCIVIAASPNKRRHFGSFLRQKKLSVFKVNPYTADEAMEFFCLTGVTIEPSDFARRYYQVCDE